MKGWKKGKGGDKPVAGRKSATGAKWVVRAAAIGCLIFFLVGCGGNAGDRGDFFGAVPFAAESREGLILEGEGPIPARLIYRSSNSISSEEDRLVIEAITQELDRLVDLAGRLDEVVIGETTRTDHLVLDRGGADEQR